MKKKIFIAMAVAAALAAMPVAAGASSSSSGRDSNGSSSSSYTTNTASSTTVQAGVASGATVVSSQPTVVVTETGAKVTVSSTTKDATGTTMGLAGETSASVAVGTAETAGLPDGVVSTIKALNNTSTSVSAVLPGLGLDGFSGVGGTRAIVAKNAAGADAPTAVSLYVDTLPASSTVKVLLYNNATGQWTVLSDVAVDLATKTVNFTVPGSCTIKIVVK